MRQNFTWRFLQAVVALLVLGSFALFSGGCGKTRVEAIRIGAALPLTGEGAVYGEMAKMAIDLAAEEINAEGGIQGRNLSVIFEDTQMKPDLAVSAVSKLITVDRVPAIVGPMTSNEFIPAVPIAQKQKVVLISPSATSHEITQLGQYKFRTIASDIYDGTAMAQFSFKELGNRKAAVFYVNEAGPAGVSQSFIDEFGKLGGTILGVEKGSQNDTDFRSQISKLKNLDPDVVYFAAYTRETIIFLRQAFELGLKKPLMTHQVIDDPTALQQAGTAAEGIYFTTPKLTPETGGPTVSRFFSRFQQKYGVAPQNFAPNAYDAVCLLADAIRKYGPTADGIARGLSETKGYQGASGVITIDGNGDVTQSMMIMMVKNGKPTRVGRS